MNMSLGEVGGPLSDTVKDAVNSGMSSPATTKHPPRYPPSAVKKWRTCPEFWRLSKVWEPRAAGWTPHRAVGQAIHAGIAAWLRPQIAGFTSLEPPPDPLPMAFGVLNDAYQEQDTWALDGLQALTAKGLKRLQRLVEDEILPGATVIAVEYPDPIQDPRLGTERLHRVIDCILARGDGLEVWDWKTKIRLDEAYVGEAQRAVLHSWQLLDYSWHTECWAKMGVYGPSYDEARISHAAHGLVILGPKLLAQAIPIAITQERLAQWRGQAARVWQAMWECQRSDGPALMNWEVCSDRHLHYGKECQFVPACHLLCGNEERFSGVYQQRKGSDGLHDSNQN